MQLSIVVKQEKLSLKNNNVYFKDAEGKVDKDYFGTWILHRAEGYLNGIQGLVDTIKEGLLLSFEDIEYLYKSIEKLNDSIDNIIYLSEIDSKKIKVPKNKGTLKNPTSIAGRANVFLYRWSLTVKRNPNKLSKLKKDIKEINNLIEGLKSRLSSIIIDNKINKDLTMQSS